MFGKLFVQEWLDYKKAVVFGTLSVALVVVVLSFPVHLLNIQFLSSLASIVAIVGASAAFVATCIFLGLGYWQTTRGSRAYFTFTIPATGRQVFWAKVVFAYLMAMAAIAIILVALLSTLWANARASGESLSVWFGPIRDFLGQLGAWKVITVGVVILLFVFLYVSAVAALISITAQEKYQRHAGTFILAIVLAYAVGQLLNVVSMIFLPGALSLSTGELTWATMASTLIETIRTGADPNVLGLGFIPVTLVYLSSLTWWGLRTIERPSVR